MAARGPAATGASKSTRSQKGCGATWPNTSWCTRRARRYAELKVPISFLCNRYATWTPAAQRDARPLPHREMPTARCQRKHIGRSGPGHPRDPGEIHAGAIEIHAAAAIEIHAAAIEIHAAATEIHAAAAIEIHPAASTEIHAAATEIHAAAAIEIRAGRARRYAEMKMPISFLCNRYATWTPATQRDTRPLPHREMPTARCQRKHMPLV